MAELGNFYAAKDLLGNSGTKQRFAVTHGNSDSSGCLHAKLEKPNDSAETSDSSGVLACATQAALVASHAML